MEEEASRAAERGRDERVGRESDGDGKWGRRENDTQSLILVVDMCHSRACRSVPTQLSRSPRFLNSR